MKFMLYSFNEMDFKYIQGFGVDSKEEVSFMIDIILSLYM